MIVTDTSALAPYLPGVYPGHSAYLCQMLSVLDLEESHVALFDPYLLHTPFSCASWLNVSEVYCRNPPPVVGILLLLLK